MGRVRARFALSTLAAMSAGFLACDPDPIPPDPPAPWAVSRVPDRVWPHDAVFVDGGFVALVSWTDERCPGAERCSRLGLARFSEEGRWERGWVVSRKVHV